MFGSAQITIELMLLETNKHHKDPAKTINVIDHTEAAFEIIVSNLAH